MNSDPLFEALERGVDLLSDEGQTLACAIHEAGHVVIGMHYSLTLDVATIVDNHDEQYLGATKWTLDKSMTQLTPEMYAVLTVAGVIAEGVCYGKDNVPAWHSRRDMKQLYAILKTLLQGDRVFADSDISAFGDELATNAIPETEQLLKAKWVTVKHVTALLLLHKTINSKHLLQLDISHGDHR